MPPIVPPRRAVCTNFTVGVGSRPCTMPDFCPRAAGGGAGRVTMIARPESSPARRDRAFVLSRQTQARCRFIRRPSARPGHLSTVEIKRHDASLSVVVGIRVVVPVLTVERIAACIHDGVPQTGTRWSQSCSTSAFFSCLRRVNQDVFQIVTRATSSATSFRVTGIIRRCEPPRPFLPDATPT